ncbi:MAG: molybdopterin cofactor-binding domain-containing protein [Clostridium sp.]
MSLKVVGKSILRVDADAKVTGKAIYPQDIYMDGMLFGKTFRSTRPHANIKVDVTKAEALEGVVKVFTAADVTGENAHGVMFKDHEVFASKKVRRVGDPIAFVVAKTEKIAIEALDLIEVEYEDLVAYFDPEEAIKEGAVQIHDGQDNLLYHYKMRKGHGTDDIQKAFDECDVVVENTYNVPQVDHAFLQPEAGVAYLEEDGTVVLCYATQYQHFDRIEVAEALGVPNEKVKLINPAVGGAFGGREDAMGQIHLSLAAMVLKVPVKTVYSREESFMAHSKRHGEKITVRTGALKSGKLHAIEATVMGDSGAYASWAFSVLRKSGVHMTGPYEIPHIKVDSMAVYTNNPFAGAMRGFGATQVPVAYEQQMDMLAEKLGITPLEIRKANIFKNGSITGTGQKLVESVPLDRCIEAVEADLSKPSESKPGKLRGRGVASAFYGTGYGNGFPDESEAHVELSEGGKVTVFVGAAEVGQGCKTALAQIPAESLGLKFEDIIFVSDDTSLTTDSGTAAASRQTYNTGNAIKRAADKLRAELTEIARQELELNSDVGFVFEDGKIYLETFEAKCITFEELYKRRGAVRCKGNFTAQTVQMDDDGQGVPYWPYTFNACAVEVEVDTATGRIEVTEASHAQDVGRAVNPLIIEGQMDGGFAMGVGYAIYEDLGVKNGVIKNNKFTNYIIPTAMDLPRVRNIIIEDPETTAPYGAKGIGEPVMVAVAPAILNAIYDATGVRMTDIPVTPERMLKALRAKGIK